jgi:hypothetical protein
VLRRFHLNEDEGTICLNASVHPLRLEHCAGIYSPGGETAPRAVVIFNGMFFPEAAVRFVCLSKGIKVITHEVGMRPFTAFFTTGEATAYPIKIDPAFKLTV